MRFAVVPLEEGAPIPGENCFLVGSNGVFLRKVGPIEAVTPIAGVSGLQTVRPYVRLNTGKIPFNQFYKTLLFFRAVYARYESEAFVSLYYAKERDEFLVYAPSQVVRYSHATYDAESRFSGYLHIGTMHSHCNFSAAPSSEDLRDARYTHGLHIIIGCVDRKYIDLSARLSVRGTHTEIDPERVIQGIRPVRGNRGDAYPYFAINPPRGIDLSQIVVPRKWMKRVRPEIPEWLIRKAERCRHA